MADRDIITIGASAGGVEALKTLVAGLPGDLQAAVFVILHLPAGGRSFLAKILSDAGNLPVIEPEDGEPVRLAQIYVAPPDFHLLLVNHHIHLARSPKEGRQRPSINVAFRSAALAYGERVIGVVLTGMLDDGTAGLWEIKRKGGLAIVQDPDEATCPSMPVSAMQEVVIDYRAKLAEMGPLLAALTAATEVHLSEEQSRPDQSNPEFSGLTCPDCRGPLWETRRGTLVQYRCRVGHSYSTQSLLDEHTSMQERKLYEAILALQEGADLSEYAAARADTLVRPHLIEQAEELRQHAEDVRRMIETRKVVGLE